MTPLRAACLLLLGCVSLQPAASAQEAPPPISARIVNGVLTDAYPTTGALVSPADPARAELVCTGVMIGCRTFLTAAHCVCNGTGGDCPSAELDASDQLVFLQHAGFFPVERITVHPDYVFPDSDIAVLRLAEDVTGVSPTPLPNASPGVGVTATVVGFGRSGGNADDFGLKRFTKVEIATCTEGLAPPLQFCWNFLDPIGEPGEDGNTCNGDSGGPLFVDLGLGPVVGGVTSGGTTIDCLPPDESWDTNVHHFVDWVRAQAGADVDAASCGSLSQVGDIGTQVDGFAGMLSAEKEQAAHDLDVPEGAAELRVTLNASEQPGADFDLSVRSAGASEPAAECSATGSSQWGACLFEAPPAGPWELVVQRNSGEGEYQVTATSFQHAVDPTPPGEPQSRAQRKCLKVQGKLGRKLAAAQARGVRDCFSNASRGRTDKLGVGGQTRSAQACLGNDVKGRVDKVARKIAKKDGKVCSEEPPDFGYAGSDAVGTAPVDAWIGWIAALFGPELDAAVAAEASDPVGAACQEELVRRVGDVWDAALRTAFAETNATVADGAENGTVLAAALESAWLGDPTGKISKASAKLRTRLAKRCGGAALAGLFPGGCATATTTDELAACAAQRALCAMCGAEEISRSLELDCDQIDDGSANASCS